MRCAPIILAIGFALILPAPSRAAETPTAREKAAKKACAAGDFRKGVEILADLYVETDDVTYIFNQGRCYEQNHQWVSAIDRFREYQRKNINGTAAERADAEKHIADCGALREQEEGRLAPVAVASPPPVSAASASPPPTLPPTPAPAALERAEASTGHPGAGLRVTGIVLGSVGIAAAATGLLLNLKANNLGDDYNKTKDPATKSSYSSYKTGSVIGYGAGGGLLVTGVILYLVGRSAGGEQRSSQTAVVPSFSSSHVSIALRSQF